MSDDKISARIKGNNLCWQDYLLVFQIVWKGGMKSVYDTDIEGCIRSYENFFERDLTPEETMIRKEAATNLSDDAKEVVRLIFSSSDQVCNAIRCPKADKISKKRIFSYLRKEKRWSEKKIQRCFDELRIYVSSL